MFGAWEIAKGIERPIDQKGRALCFHGLTPPASSFRQHPFNIQSWRAVLAFGAFALEEVGAVGAVAVSAEGVVRVPTGADEHPDVLQMIITRKVCPRDQDLIVAIDVAGNALGGRHGVRQTP